MLYLNWKVGIINISVLVARAVKQWYSVMSYAIVIITVLVGWLVF